MEDYNRCFECKKYKYIVQGGTCNDCIKAAAIISRFSRLSRDEMSIILEMHDFKFCDECDEYKAAYNFGCCDEIDCYQCRIPDECDECHDANLARWNFLCYD